VELADVARLLADPTCRLLTLTGPGGVGKTRLAIEAARRHQHGRETDIAFVTLLDVSTAPGAPVAIAVALDVALSGQSEPRAQLLDALRHRRLLLVLDNFEHLTDAAPILSDLLTAAPDLKLLVTSREALQLHEEWRYPVAGLPVDDNALRLFAERARRVRPDFSPAAEREAIIRICRLVEGMPLAIEMAAGWVTTLSCTAIADEIEQDLSLLATSLRNAPERHRSMRAVCDHSWRLLRDEERAVLRRLAVFRGGFGREAAADIAGAGLSVLAALVAKSLLRHRADGRYELHELVRHYAMERLRTDQDELERVGELHAAYYLAFLTERGGRLIGGDQRFVLEEIAAELENVRGAWRRTLDRMDVEIDPLAVSALAGFYHLRGRYREGLDILAATLSRLREVPPSRPVERALPAVLHEVGQLYTRLGRFAEARAALEEARARYIRLGAPLPAGPATDPEIALGVLALVDGDDDAAERLGEAVRRRAEREEHTGNLPYGWYLAAQTRMARGQFAAAREAAEAARAAAVRSRDDWFLAYCLNDLGTIAAAVGDLATARDRYQASFALREAFGDPEGTAVALVHLGRVAILDGNGLEARGLCKRALAIYRDIGDRGGQAAAFHSLGTAAVAAGDAPAAARHFGRALAIAGAIGLAPRSAAVVVDAADLFLTLDQPARAVEALSAVLDHPAADRVGRERARRLLSAAKKRLDPARYAAAVERGRSGTFDDLIARLPTDLAGLTEDAGAVAPALDRSDAGPAESLVDPLTERELAVLRLIAAGRSNRQIADELFLAVSTVKWYAGQIFGKLDARNRTEAVARARDLGLLP
jgi:predicted ATPase/DNA-binding NarL/FixJ family response regulator